MTTNFGTKEVTLTRVFDAPRELVWQSWTDPKHMAQWWGPRVFTNPVCELDVRPGGKMWIVMRGPAHTAFDMDFPMSGTFEEIAPPERLVFTAVAEDKNGHPQLRARTVVTFEEQGGKTKLTVKASAVGLTPMAPQMLAGMDDGWSQSLDKLGELVVSLR